MAEGPHGAFYFTDWVFTSYELHGCGRLWKLEIDRSSDWLTPKEIEPQNDESRLAAELRSGKSKLTDQQLLEHARGDDPFLARAALQALSPRLGDYPADWDDEDRANAVYARRLTQPLDDIWIRAALTDKSDEVRFEALHWIADEMLTDFASDIDAIFAEPDLDYYLFEACLAAANTLKGQSRQGIADITMLIDRVTDPTASSATQAYSLRLLPPAHPKVTMTLLMELLASAGDGNRELVLEVLRTMAGKADKEALEIAATFAAKPRNPETARVEAILGLAAAPDDHLATLNALRNDPSVMVADEAERALRGGAATIENPTPTIATQGPPPLTDIPARKALIDAVKGEPDLEAGRRIFFHPSLTRCATCHRHSGRGAVVGPDLSAVGAGPGADTEWLLSQILDPNREVAPQFYPWQLGLADGSTFMGIALRKGGRSGKEFYRDITGTEQAILKTDIVTREEVKASLMPPGLTLNLTATELRDLIAFLQSSGVNQ